MAFRRVGTRTGRLNAHNSIYGLIFSSVSASGIVRDQIQILFCDLDLDYDDLIHHTKLLTYLEGLRELLMDLLDEEDVWIIHYSVTRTR
jgi:hypothetical protein